VAYDAAHDHLGPAGTKAIGTLLAGLAGVEVIPARWLVAELLLTIAERGFEVARTPRGAALRARLARLRFFKNGVLALRGAHLPSWIMIGVTVSSGLYSALGGKSSQGRLLYTWEKWLFDLVDTDIEHFTDESPEVLLPPAELDAALARLGNEAEDWFAYLVLGLMEVSPRLQSVLEALAAGAPEPVAERAADESEVPDVLGEKGSIQR
jgi:hypothetical protein